MGGVLVFRFLNMVHLRKLFESLHAADGLKENLRPAPHYLFHQEATWKSKSEIEAVALKHWGLSLKCSLCWKSVLFWWPIAAFMHPATSVVADPVQSLLNCFYSVGHPRTELGTWVGRKEDTMIHTKLEHYLGHREVAHIMYQYVLHIEYCYN